MDWGRFLGILNVIVNELLISTTFEIHMVCDFIPKTLFYYVFCKTNNVSDKIMHT